MLLKSIVKSDPPFFSLVVPNYNGARTLREALAAIRGAYPPPGEVIVADDASRDGSEAIASEFGAALIRGERCRGASANRNAGAAAARGDILVFVDNDVVVPPDTFARLEEIFRRPEVSGVIGLLKPATRFPNLCSQYKNFYMHYTYMKMPDPVTVFYTSIAAIRKDVFEKCGGFDPAYRSATIEDMEFGVRVTAQGYAIVIDRHLQVEHLKHYFFRDLLKTAFRRAAGLAKIALRDRLKRGDKRAYVTTSGSFLAGMVLSSISLLLLIASLIFISFSCLILAVACYLLLLTLNAGFLVGLARATRPLYFFLGCGLLYIDLLAHSLGVGSGIVGFCAARKY